MILLAHMLLGAAIGSRVGNLPLAIVLSLAGHYALDFVPHIEYSIKNLEEKNWRRALPDFFKVFLDFLAGLSLIYFFSANRPIIYLCAIVAILPDFVTLLGWILPEKILGWHYDLHEKIHWLKYKKIPRFWRIASQVTVVVICLALLKL
jgi:hypothetical protein